jgi:hypothetical protein
MAWIGLAGLFLAARLGGNTAPAEPSTAATETPAAAPALSAIPAPAHTVALPLGRIEATSSYADWESAVARLPSYRALKGRLPPASTLPFGSLEVLLDLARTLHERCAVPILGAPDLWVGEPPPRAPFLDPARAYYADPQIPFSPFAQKVVVPEGAELVFQGDLHGDVRSLVATCAWLCAAGYLDGFKLARQNVYLVFLGDYTDRGVYGAEVLYTLLRLKLANPHHVLLVRGNHEDFNLVSRYGFLAELQAKFPGHADPKPLLRLFDYLPVVLYVGCGGDFIQCNHGGLEPGYTPATLLAAPGGVRCQLLGEVRQASFFDAHAGLRQILDAPSRPGLRAVFRDFRPTSPTTPTTLGFMWNDFTVVRGQPELEIDPDRALVYGPKATAEMLRAASSGDTRIRAVFRGHQHAAVLNPLMSRLLASRGLFRHWQEHDGLAQLQDGPAELAGRLETPSPRAVPPDSVWTFNVAPDSVYGVGCGFAKATVGILKTAARFDEWRIRTVEIEVSSGTILRTKTP